MIERIDRATLRQLVSSRASILDAADNPFATAAWITNYIDQVVGDDGVILAADIDGRALLLLQADVESPWQARALNNYYSSLFSPFLGSMRDGDAERVIRNLCSSRLGLATVDLSPLSEADAAASIAAFKAAGWITRRYSCFGNWYLPCEGLCFDDFMAGRIWRKSVNNWARKERNSKTGPIIRLEVVTESSELAKALEAYNRVYSRSWKQPEPYPGFVPGWAAVCAQRGWLRLGVAWSGETPIAAQLWFTINRRAYIYKLAYDEAYSKLSAGTILSAFMFRRALDVDRVVEIDYLTGDDEYKRAWMTQRRERVGLIACNPWTIRGGARAIYELSGAARQKLRAR